MPSHLPPVHNSTTEPASKSTRNICIENSRMLTGTIIICEALDLSKVPNLKLYRANFCSVTERIIGIGSGRFESLDYKGSEQFLFGKEKAGICYFYCLCFEHFLDFIL